MMQSSTFKPTSSPASAPRTASLAGRTRSLRTRSTAKHEAAVPSDLWYPSWRNDPGARSALAAGLDRWEAALRAGLEGMQANGLLAADCDPGRLATSILASVQGGLVLTQARRDPQQLRHALDGALALLGAHRPR